MCNMAKGFKKHTKAGPIADERFARAQAHYLEKLGQISDVQLAKKMGVHRNTIKKWKTKGNWDALVTQTQQSVDKKLTESAATKIVKETDAVLKEIDTNMRLLSLAARKKMIMEDENGRPILDANGHPKINPALSAASIRSLVGCMETYQKMVRLRAGLSTENSRITGEMQTTTKSDDQFDKRMAEIMATGDPEGQKLLAEFLALRQRLMNVTGGADQ